MILTSNDRLLVTRFVSPFADTALTVAQTRTPLVYDIVVLQLAVDTLNVKVLPNAIFTNHIENCFPRKRHLLFSNLTIGDYPISSWTTGYLSHTNLLMFVMPKDIIFLVQTVDGSPQLSKKRIFSFICSPRHCVKKATDPATHALCCWCVTLASLFTEPGQFLSPPYLIVHQRKIYY